MWTYDYYLDLIDYGMHHNNSFFLRHDVDISLKKALEMAEVEATRKLHSTYYILLSSPYYNALSPENLEKISKDAVWTRGDIVPSATKKSSSLWSS